MCLPHNPSLRRYRKSDCGMSGFRVCLAETSVRRSGSFDRDTLGSAIMRELLVWFFRTPITVILIMCTGEIIREKNDSLVKEDTVVGERARLGRVAVAAGRNGAVVLLINVKLRRSAPSSYGCRRPSLVCPDCHGIKSLSQS